MRTILLWNDDWAMADAPRVLGDTGFELVRDRRHAPLADAIVFHLPTLQPASMPTGRRPGQRWVAWWLESEVNYPCVDDPAFMRPFDFTLTHRRPADVWATYLPPLDELMAPPVDKTASVPAVYIASNARERSGRDAYVAELKRHIDVDTYGRRPGDRRIPDDDGRRAKLLTIARYRFTLAFENSIAPDYVTEKFYDALIAGSVPVVLGAPNVRDFAPGDPCYLDVADYADPAALAAELKRLAADEDAYQRFLAWKRTGLRREFGELLSRVAVDPWIRLARKLKST